MLWGQFDDVQERLSYFINNMFMFCGVLAVSSLLLLVYWKGWLNRKYLVLIVAVIVLADLWPVDWKMIKTIPASNLEDVFYKETPQIKMMEADKDGPFRVFAPGVNNELLVRGIQSLTGYHPVPLTYYMKTLENVNFRNPVLDLLNTKYLLLPKEPGYDFAAIPDAAARNMMMEKYEVLDNTDCYFYKRKKPLPRAWLVNRLLKVDDVEQALDAISDPRFPPFVAAAVSDNLPVAFSMDPNADLSGQKVQVTKYLPDEVDIDVDAPANSFLVASEVWYPGWKAYIDGKKTDVYRTDYVLRGVPFPKGRHRLVFRFRPWTYTIGAVVSLLTLAYLVSVIFINRRRRGPS